MSPTDSILAAARANGSTVLGNVVVSYDRAARSYAVGTVIALHARGPLSTIQRPLMALLAGSSEPLAGARWFAEMTIRAARIALTGNACV